MRILTQKLMLALVLAIAATASTSQNAGAEAWDSNSSPFRFRNELYLRYEKLKSEARISKSKMPWSDSYWPHYKGSIAYRWQTKETVWSYRSPSKSRLFRSASNYDISILSPAEKFDLLMGRYDYPLTSYLDRNMSPNASSWEGICNGWAAASINHAEPKPVVMVNPDGLSIPFGSSDIKALLSYFYSTRGVNSSLRSQNRTQIGKRCESQGLGRVRDEDCRGDVNAGALHLILGNLIGEEDQAFIADMTNGNEVWNHPVIGYSFREIKSGIPCNHRCAPKAVERVRIEATLTYVDEVKPNYEVLDYDSKKSRRSEESMTFKYDLELDSKGKIVGGQYNLTNGMKSPDFLWMLKPLELDSAWKSAYDFGGSELKSLFESSIRK